MTLVLEREARNLVLWKTARALDSFAVLLGEAPVRVRLDRVHFPAKRPVQLNFTATMPSGMQIAVLAEHATGDPSAHAARIIESLRKSRNGQRSALTVSPVVADGKTGLVLRRPGLDERLPGLRVLHDAEFAKDCLVRMTGRKPGKIRTRLLAHRLGKRAVIQIEAGRTRFYARFRAIKSCDGADRLARHRAVWEALRGKRALRVPEPLGALPELGLSLFGELPGGSPAFGCDGKVVADALDALQNLDLEGLPVHDGAGEARLLRDWYERCRLYLPSVADSMASAIKAVCDDLSKGSGALRPCHRDLHEKQILVAGGVAGFLDFDTLSLADPAVDPGNLLAHLFLSGQDERPLRRLLNVPRLELWRRAAMLRLAMIYAFTSIPDALIRRLVNEAIR